MLIVKGRKKIIFTGRRDFLQKLHSTVNFAVCRISVNCPGAEMGCDSIGGASD